MLVAYGSGFRPVPVRGVCAEYGEMRSEVPSDGRWISPDDVLERRRVVFLGSLARQRLCSGRPAVGETVLIGGLRFTVIGSMDRKLQLSNYFWSDDESMFIPFTAAADLWDNAVCERHAVLHREPAIRAQGHAAGARGGGQAPALFAHRQARHHHVRPRGVPGP